MAALMNEFSDLLRTDNVGNSRDEEAICRLQAHIRAFLIRKKFQQVRSLYKDIVNEVEGDVCLSSKLGTVHWKTHLPCRPSILLNPRKLSAGGPRRAQTCASQEPSTDPEPVRGASQHTGSREAFVRSEGGVSQADVKRRDADCGSKVDGDCHWRARDSDDDQATGSGISRSEETLNPLTQTQHQTPSVRSASSEDEEESPRANVDVVHLDQSATSSEKAKESGGSGEPSKQSYSSSGSSDRVHVRESPVSSVEYTTDFESCTSTTTSQRTDSDGDQGNGTTLEMLAASPLDNGTPASDAIQAPDRMESREDSSEEIGHQNIGKAAGYLLSTTGKAASNPSLSDADWTARVDVGVRPDHHQHPHGAAAMADETDSSSRAEMRGLPSGTDPGTRLPWQDEPESGRKTSSRDGGSDVSAEEQRGRSPSGEVQDEAGSSGEHAEAETAATSSRPPGVPEHQGDEKEGGDESWRPSSRESGVAGGGVPIILERRAGERDALAAADTTSIWSNEDSFAELKADDYPSDLEELEAMRSGVAMELLWVQQAIDSRKKYLRLKSHLQPT